MPTTPRAAQPATPPATRREDLVETLHGIAVADPYRWLEDADSAEVAAWAAAQGAHAEAVLTGYPERPWFADAMARIVARPRAGVPTREGGRWYVSRHDGVRPQAVWYAADSLEELEAGGDVALDPNAWSADGTTSLSVFSASQDGRYLAYARSEGGSDWQQVRVRDLRSGEELADRLVAKFSSLTWLPDGRSFLYATYDQAQDARGTATEGLGPQRLMRHVVGAAEDTLVAEADGPEVFLEPVVSHDGRWLVLQLYRGTERGNRLRVAPLTTEDGASRLGEWVTVEPGRESAWTFVRSDGESLILLTDAGAERGRVVRRAVAAGSPAEDLVPEGAATLASVVPVGDGLLVVGLEDAQTRLDVHGLDGTYRGRVEVPAGALVDVFGEVGTEPATVGLSTVDEPTQSYAVDADGRARALALAAASGPSAPAYTVTRHRATSKDGTAVPYFLVRPAHAPAGPRPTILYGYGGFDIPVQADYRPGWPAWLAAGGCLAVANLRGGGEEGAAWAEAGKRERKQNVFDDFVACAEHLAATGATTPAQLALHGRSNGGLLVGAVMTQRPDVAAVALPAVGVLDLARFHLFTIGAAWKSDYGDPEVEADLRTALAYSPVHNVHAGTAYPATLVATADHDDRVVPLHSYKFAAALQHAQAGDAPVLLRVETSAGHGAGKSIDMIAREWTDLLTFAAHHTGLTPAS